MDASVPQGPEALWVRPGMNLIVTFEHPRLITIINLVHSG